MNLAVPSPTAVHIDQFAANIQSVCGRFCVTPMRHQSEVLAGVGVFNPSGFDIVSVTQNARSIERTALDVRRDPGEHFFLILQERGDAKLGQNGELRSVVEGDMFLVDSALPSHFLYDGKLTTQLSLHLPRDEQIHRFGRRISGGMHISGRDPLAQAMRSILTSVMTHEDPSQVHVTEAFYSVFGAYLLNRALGDTSKPDPRRVLVQRATEVMARYFREPEFSASHVAEKMNVSLRHLQRAFKLVDDTLQKRLMHMRLDAARRTIRDGEASSVAQVAYSSGFSDLSTFHRQYKSRFDEPPGVELKARRLLQ